MMKELEVGDLAPVFVAKDQQGKTWRLEDFAGQTLVLYFYPKDNTPGCTAQACNMRDNFQQLSALGIKVLGVSVDDENSHQKFIAKHDLPFTLLADTEQNLVQQYGVWQEKNMYGKKYMGTLRRSFIIDAQGRISHIIKKVDTKNAAQQILDLLQEK